MNPRTDHRSDVVFRERSPFAPAADFATINPQSKRVVGCHAEPCLFDEGGTRHFEGSPETTRLLVHSLIRPDPGAHTGNRMQDGICWGCNVGVRGRWFASHHLYARENY